MKTGNSLLEVLNIEALKILAIIIVSLFIAVELYRFYKKRREFKKLSQTEKCKRGYHDFKIDTSTETLTRYSYFNLKAYTEKCVCGKEEKREIHTFSRQNLKSKKI